MTKIKLTKEETKEMEKLIEMAKAMSKRKLKYSTATGLFWEMIAAGHGYSRPYRLDIHKGEVTIEEEKPTAIIDARN